MRRRAAALAGRVRRTKDRWTGKSGERPARARHCDRAKRPPHAMRQPLAERPGRRDGKARKPGDLPPIQTSTRPRGKGSRHAQADRGAARRFAFIAFSSRRPPRRRPTEVNVRIEGQSETLFEGPILTEGHNVKASSDTKAPLGAPLQRAQQRRPNPTPGPTPTAAVGRRDGASSAKASTATGTPAFEDYFITQLGARTRQNSAASAYWGVLVNNVFTTSAAASTSSTAATKCSGSTTPSAAGRAAPLPRRLPGGAGPLTATATLEPAASRSRSTPGRLQRGRSARPSPQRSTDPFEGAEVAPVVTDRGRGFETSRHRRAPKRSRPLPTVRRRSPSRTPGWHRIKATESTRRQGNGDPLQPPRRLRDRTAGDRLRPAAGRRRSGADPPPPTGRGRTGGDEPAETPAQPAASGPGASVQARRPGPRGARRRRRPVRLQLPRLDRSQIAARPGRGQLAGARRRARGSRAGRSPRRRSGAKALAT